MVNIYSQQKFANDLIKYILARTSGSDKADEFVRGQSPSKVFIIGTLASRKEEQINGEAIIDDSRSSIRAQRMKVSFLSDKKSFTSDSSLKIMATGNVYYGVDW